MALALEQARTNVRIASGVDIVAGLWMIAAPFFLAYSYAETAMWNSVIVGLAIALLASRREFGEGYRYATSSWVNVALGAWLVVSPFFLGFSGIEVALWNHVIVGAGVVVFALWSALATPHERA